LTSPRSTAAPRGTLPWSGPRTGSSGYGKPDVLAKYRGHLWALHERRTVEQLEDLLAERLAKLRSAPPVGYPTRP
jgi:hypothetical protein